MVLLACCAAAPAASIAAERVELPIDSASAQQDVRSSLVKIKVPLPASTPKPYPAACDWVQYLRFKHVDGPAKSTDAAAVSVLMPGVLEGATAFDQVARNTIREQARRGRHIEVWGIDRRSACVEDLTGLDHLERTGDAKATTDYYYRGRELDGRKFAGFKAPRVVAEFGIARTVSDYYSVITEELPDQAWRERHVICGGHSLGGPITELFAAWDADGKASTTEDAGYRQCAGFVGFDTPLAGRTLTSSSRVNPTMQAVTAGLLKTLDNATVRSLRAGSAPRSVDLAGIGPETMTLLDAVGAIAARNPDADLTETLSYVPDTPTIKTFFHLQGSASMDRFLFSKDSVREQRYSAMAMLGQVMDDNGGVFSLVHSSIGFFEGPVVRNRFALQAGQIPGLGGLIRGGSLFQPKRSAAKPLIRWRDYDELGSAPAITAGTTAADEITDAREFARVQSEGPTNMVESYFPTRIMLDLSLVGAGSRSGTLANFVHADGIFKAPRFTIVGGDGLLNTRSHADPHVVLPGYQHLDVLTAAERQNNGQPEGSSQAFANLIDAAIAD